MDARTRDGMRGLADALAGYREGACETCAAYLQPECEGDCGEANARYAARRVLELVCEDGLAGAGARGNVGDTWERVDDDCTMPPRDYHARRIGGDVGEMDDASVHEAVCRDLVRRARALAERGL